MQRVGGCGRGGIKWWFVMRSTTTEMRLQLITFLNKQERILSFCLLGLRHGGSTNLVNTLDANKSRFLVY